VVEECRGYLQIYVIGALQIARALFTFGAHKKEKKLGAEK
jgi:hypothetical protein